MGIKLATEYPYYSELDEDSACRLALSKVLQEYDGWRAPGVRSLKVEVHEEWPEGEAVLNFPSIVLGDAEGTYPEAPLSPQLIPDTEWPDFGIDRFILQKDAEYQVDLPVHILASGKPMRRALLLGVRKAIIKPPTPEQPKARFGQIVQVPEYWNCRCRLTLISLRREDTESEVGVRHRVATAVIRAQIAAVQLAEYKQFRSIKFVNNGDSLC